MKSAHSRSGTNSEPLHLPEAKTRASRPQDEDDILRRAELRRLGARPRLRVQLHDRWEVQPGLFGYTSPPLLFFATFLPFYLYLSVTIANFPVKRNTHVTAVDYYYQKVNTGSFPDVAGWYAENLDIGFVEPAKYATADINCHKNSAPGAISATVKAGGSLTFAWGPDKWPHP